MRTVSVAIRMEDSLHKTFVAIAERDESSVAAVIRKYAKLGLAKEGLLKSSVTPSKPKSDLEEMLGDDWKNG